MGGTGTEGGGGGGMAHQVENRGTIKRASVQLL